MADSAVFDFSAGLEQFRTGAAKNIRRPREFAYYSLDKQRNVLPMSLTSLRYSYPCMANAPYEFGELPQDVTILNQISLRDGFSSFEKYDDSADEHLDAILDTLEAYEVQQSTTLQPDFVMFRGMMTKLMTAPYEHGNDASFEMNATFFQNTIYIEQHKAHKIAEDAARKQRDQRKPRRQQDSHQEKPSPDEMAYWGYKFETLCSLDRPYVDASRAEIAAQRTATVSNAEQYCSLVNTGIDDLAIILAGEVDAVRGSKPDDVDAAIPWVEFKTNRALLSDQDDKYWADKLLRVWTQSYLLGVPTVVVGFRSQFGQLLSIREYETRALPGLAKSIMLRQGNSSPWDGSVCINFAGAFLKLLRAHITAPGVVWRLKRIQGQRHIQVFAVDVKPETIIKPSFAIHRNA